MTPFQFIGNDLALDFVNTQIREGGVSRDLIDTPEALSRWLGEASLEVGAAAWSSADRATLHALRTAILALVSAAMDGEPVEVSVLDVINSHLKNHRAAPHLAQSGDDFHLSVARDHNSPAALMAALAHAAAELVTTTERKRIKCCAHPECVLVFKDTSKSGRRRWCSMETCGNRVKAATFRANI